MVVAWLCARRPVGLPGFRRLRFIALLPFGCFFFLFVCSVLVAGAEAVGKFAGFAFGFAAEVVGARAGGCLGAAGFFLFAVSFADVVQVGMAFFFEFKQRIGDKQEAYFAVEYAIVALPEAEAEEEEFAGFTGPVLLIIASFIMINL